MTFLLLSGAAAARGGEVSAWNAFRSGDLEAARRALEENPPAPGSDANLAVVLRDLGREEEALAVWVRSTQRPDADGFLWNQRAWSELSLGRPDAARVSFNKAIERSKSSASQAEANLGLALVALDRGHPKDATAPLRSLLVQGPYLLPLGSRLMALAALGVGEKKVALTYLRQSAELDPEDLESLRELARIEARAGDKTAAVSRYLRLAGLDPADSEAVSKARGFSDSVRRMQRPLLDAGTKKAPALAANSDLRVSLFSDEEGRPGEVEKVSLIANSPFRLTCAEGGPAAEGGAFELWEASWRPSEGLEFRDAAGNLRLSGKGNCRVRATLAGGSILLRQTRLAAGAQPEDRELRGGLELSPGEKGMRLANRVPLERYLYGVVGAAIPAGAPADAYRAQAVVARTRALWLSKRPEGLCDSAFCQSYHGVSSEMRQSVEGVRATEGYVLTYEGRIAEILSHENCGGRTEAGPEGSEALAHIASVSDGPERLPDVQEPAQIERWTHEFPPSQSYCESSTLTPPVQSRWVRLIEAGDLRRRAALVKDLGDIRAVRPARRSLTGRVEALFVEGSRGVTRLEGAKKISDLLSPGTLPSTMFTMVPLRHGKRLERLLVWGAGHGHGLGLCRAGAIGEADLGTDWKGILAHYFPRMKLQPPPGAFLPAQ